MVREFHEFEFKQYVKIIIIKIDTFSSEIVDEKHFSTNDEFGMSKFKNNYKNKNGSFYILTTTM